MMQWALCLAAPAHTHHRDLAGRQRVGANLMAWLGFLDREIRKRQTQRGKRFHQGVGVAPVMIDPAEWDR